MLEYFKKTKLGRALRRSKFLKKLYLDIFVANKKKRIKKSFKKNGKKVLQDLTCVLNRSNFKYFAAFGTLLGFIREKKTISYDLDYDFGVINDSIFNLNSFLSLLYENGYELHHWYEHDGITHEFTVFSRRIDKNIHIDFFIFDIDENHFEKYAYYKENDLYEVHVEYLPLFDNTIMIKVFDDIDVPVPENYEEFLVAAYTENWRTPDPNWSSYSKPNQHKVEGKFGIKVKNVISKYYF